MSHPSESLPLVAGAKKYHKLLGLGLVGVSALSFSLMSATIKYESVYLSSMETVFWRSSIAWIINLLVVLYTKTSLVVEVELRWYLAIRCLCGFISMSCAFYAISQMVLADASVLIFTTPIMTFFLGAAFLKEKVECIDVTCAIVALTGVVFVVRPVFLFHSNELVKIASAAAIIAALVGAFAKAVAFVVIRKMPSIHFLVVVHYLMLSSSIISGIWIAIFDHVFHVALDLYAWLGIGAIGLLGFLGQISLTKGLQIEHVGVASAMRYLDVVFVFVWDALLLREVINPWSILGGVIIIACVAVIAIRRASTEPTAAA
ncbi:Aste57867_10045 [Aphanomyces stellatus]|uniref:Aste57867_10045 protein n=1 Tax=Aphanomyces stellatus TaxID=120398 RepID=A0A485KPW6_9STRA|nr:hypothetical protein As57867_010006 [Aphanomyces stellatus]VFT86922.1 Aste57867_10045 [Aphanomyces stellatus]